MSSHYYLLLGGFMSIDSRTALSTPTDLGADATKDISGAMNFILADVFALYMKTKNFHWHVSGAHFRDFHLMFDEQATQIFAMTDEIAERIRKIGGRTLRSISHIARSQRILDNDANFVTPQDMLAELCSDNRQLTSALRETHSICQKYNDTASTSMIEVWIDQTERRTWFLYESSRRLSTES
jgi:starvation-inducible DNA-binding protein